MVEGQYGRGPEQPRQRIEGYTGFVANGLERLAQTEASGAVAWYKERLAALPEMAVTDTELTGKGGWGKEMTPGGEVERITGAFFDIPGQQISVTRPDGSTAGWNQPGIVQKEIPVTLPTPDGDVSMDASGFVGLLRDPEGNVLLTVGQEPLANTDKKALVRTPFQTSAAKLNALLEGDTAKDPNLAGVLEKVGQGRPITDLFASGEVDTFPLAPADPNRIAATNVGFSLTVRDENVREELTAGGANRWCSPAEVKGLIRAGVVNGHTAAVFAAA
jgi:hypothetical protein